MSAFLEFKSYIIYAPNLDQTNELDVAIGLEDWVEDLGFIPSLCIHASYDTSRALLSNIWHVCYSYDWAHSFDKLKRALTSIVVMCFLWKILLFTNDFNFLEDCSCLFDKLHWALVVIDRSGNLVIW